MSTSQATGVPNIVLSVLVSLFIGLMVAFCVGFGIQAFYPAPSYPAYPAYPVGVSIPSSTPSLETEQNLAKQQAQYDADTADFQKSNANHSRNASFVATLLAVLIVIFSLVATRLALIADGLLLGGLFTMIYSITLSWVPGVDGRVQFATVLVGLATGISVAYFKLVKPQKAADTAHA